MPALEENNCQINDVIKNVVGRLKPAIKIRPYQIDLTIGERTCLWPLVGPIECHQIIHNVIINAIQAMPGGGISR